MITLRSFSLHDYPHSRRGKILKLTTSQGESSLGEISPFPGRSQETLEDAVREITQRREEILQTVWTKKVCHEKMPSFLPSVNFALESALLDLLEPIILQPRARAALLQGSLDEILHAADVKEKEGYTCVKIKVAKLVPSDAKSALKALHTRFLLRVDVNRAWKTPDALAFFSDFSPTDFDYIEEPFLNPQDLHLFTHPLGIDESFPKEVSLHGLQQLPTLKALVYKPMVLGGLSTTLPVYAWTQQIKIDFVLSSTFESPIGIRALQALHQRLHVTTPLGLGV